jgi:hypothetical protein
MLTIKKAEQLAARQAKDRTAKRVVLRAEIETLNDLRKERTKARKQLETEEHRITTLLTESDLTVGLAEIGASFLERIECAGNPHALLLARDALAKALTKQAGLNRRNARVKAKQQGRTLASDKILLANGFTPQEVETISAITKCEAPGCQNERTVWNGQDSRALARDHAHDEPCEAFDHEADGPCPECYRGVICGGCNFRFTTLDAHPEWAGVLDLLYMSRRPFSRKKTP